MIKQINPRVRKYIVRSEIGRYGVDVNLGKRDLNMDGLIL
jgi:hypothetical protein